MDSLEHAILNWARPRIEPGQVSAWPLRARAENLDDGTSQAGMWIHVHDGYEWVCSVKRSRKAGRHTVYVPNGTRVVEEDPK